MAFENEKGEHPEGCVSWQFNFKFNLQEDMYAQDSIDLLKDAGIDFERHETEVGQRLIDWWVGGLFGLIR